MVRCEDVPRLQVHAFGHREHTHLFGCVSLLALSCQHTDQANTGLFVPSFYVVDYAIAHGVDPQTAFYALAVLNAGGIFGRIIPPALADRYGRYNAMIPCIVLMGLSALVFWPFAKTVVAIMLFAAFFGFFQGAFNVLIIPCVAQISDIREIGTRVGVIYSIVSFP